MWFGTADGINRYDGYSIKVYKLKSSSAANSNFIRGNICEDADDNIWFCNETGIFCYNRRLDALETRHSFDTYNQSCGVSIDSHQNFWIIHALSGIGAFNIKNNSYRHIPFDFKVDLSVFKALKFLADGDHHILFSMQANGGFIRFNTQTLRFEKALAGNTIFSLCMYENEYCICVQDKLIFLNRNLQQKREIEFFAGREEIRAMLPDSVGRLWTASIDSGLKSYHFTSKEFLHYRHNNARLKSLPFDLSTSLFIDRTNNLWIGSDGGGVSKLDLKPPRFNLLPLNEGDYPFLKDYFTRCFYEDDKQRIWFGTNNSGLNILDPKDRSITNYIEQPGTKGTLPGNIVSAMFKDKDNNMWICGSMGTAIFNEKEKFFYPVSITGLPQPLSRHNVFTYAMLQLKNGDLLAATLQGLVKFKKYNNQFKGVSLAGHGPLASTMTSVVEMNDETIWLTLPINGLRHLKPSGDGYEEIEVLFKGIDLRSVHRDEVDADILWVCSGNGLIQLNTRTKQHRVYNEENGMANSYVYGVLEDADHNMWMSTNKGLIFFDRGSNSFKNFNVNDGLQSNEFNTSAFYKGASGTFYFGGVKGFNWFNSANNRKQYAPPGIAITSMEVNFQPYHYDSGFTKHKTISLPYNLNNISLHFAALDFTMPQANKIQFKLDGWDKEWIVSSEMNMRYTNLSPGRYTLHYKAVNSEGQWSKEELLHIVINAPFWRTWWFYTLSALLVIAFVILLTRRVAQQKLKEKIKELERRSELEKERQRIGREMHDDIGAGLTQITLMSEAAKRNLTPKKELDDIALTSRQLVTSMSEIIWSLNSENNSLDHLLSYLREQLHKFLEPSNISYQIAFPAMVPKVALNNNQRRNILLATKEMVHNAVKHSQATEITIEASITEQSLHISVADNGIGFDLAKKYAGNGLKNMTRRIEDLGAKPAFLSERGTGSRFAFSIPLNSHSQSNAQ
jgi:signal transduction histidine kinase/ligand-binding sensor domain-containing protein